MVPSSRIATAKAGSNSSLGVLERSTLKGLFGSGARIWFTIVGSGSITAASPVLTSPKNVNNEPKERTLDRTVEVELAGKERETSTCWTKRSVQEWFVGGKDKSMRGSTGDVTKDHC